LRGEHVTMQNGSRPVKYAVNLSAMILSILWDAKFIAQKGMRKLN
jgi:hypothetical protein